MLRIAYDHELSTQLNPKYFVYDENHVVIYKGDYVQCLAVVGGLPLVGNIGELNSKCNGFLFEERKE